MPPAPRRKGRPKAFHDKTDQNTIQSLDRAVDVIEVLAGTNGLTLSEIADTLDQSPATIYRILTTLQPREIVETDTQSQTWHIGAATFRLGAAFLRRSSVIERSRPIMRELTDATGESSNLGIERRGEVMFVGQVETHESIRAFFPPGTLSPMHASGIGKALLSCYSPERLDQFIREYRLQGFTDKTITDPDRLRQDLLATRQRGFAFDDEERTTGMRCLAAPILNVHGEAVAGISVSGPTHRLPTDQIERIGALVRDAAARLSRGLGGSASSGR